MALAVKQPKTLAVSRKNWGKKPLAVKTANRNKFQATK